MGSHKGEHKVGTSAEENVSKFYNSVGWQAEQSVTEDARRWEDLRPAAQEYVSKCRLRLLRHIPADGERMLDMASGPVQYPEYLEYSKNFKKRFCVDLSSAALEQAQKKLGQHGEYLCGSFFDLPLEPNSFDCSISLHTIYHMDRDRQETAVRKLIEVTRSGRPVIIVYRNPKAVMERLAAPLKLLKRMSKRLRPGGGSDTNPAPPYFHAHPIEWWQRFSDVANVEVVPWRSLTAEFQKVLIPNNRLGQKILEALYQWEERFPRAFVKHGQYPTIVLTKR